VIVRISKHRRLGVSVRRSSIVDRVIIFNDNGVFCTGTSSGYRESLLKSHGPVF